MRKPILLILLSTFLFTCTTPLIADSVYASDQLTVPMRTGTTDRHKIIRFIPSGEKLELLELNDEEGFSRVMSDTGTEGWVKNTNLIKQPGGYEQLEKARQQLNAERDKIKQLQDNIKQLKDERQHLETELTTSHHKNQQLIKNNDLLGNQGLKEWFVIGALVSIGSLFLGLIIPRIQWRKKDSWSNSF